jgi:hypothetical protein
MRRHLGAGITEGEIYGSPVPGGWPNRGPFRVVGDALGRLFRKGKSADRDEVTNRPDDDRSVPDK